MFVKLLVTAMALLAAGFPSGRGSAAGTGQEPSLAAATLASARPGAWRTSSYPGVLTFDYPSDWHVARLDLAGSSGATPLVAISNIPIGPASLTSLTPPTSPTAVFAVWWDVGNDGVPFHPNTRIDGRRAQVTATSPGECPAGGPRARSISAMVFRYPSDFLELIACLPRAEMSANTTTVLAIARSLHIAAE